MRAPSDLERFIEDVVKKMGFLPKFNYESILSFKLLASNGILCDVQMEIQNERNSIFIIIFYPKVIDRKYALRYVDFFGYLNTVLDSKLVLSRSGIIVFKMNRLFNLNTYSENELIQYFHSNFNIFNSFLNHSDLLGNGTKTNKEILALIYSNLKNA